jgi:hypothetical protein
LSEEGRKRLKYGTRSLFSGLLQDLDLEAWLSVLNVAHHNTRVPCFAVNVARG